MKILIQFVYGVVGMGVFQDNYIGCKEPCPSRAIHIEILSQSYDKSL